MRKLKDNPLVSEEDENVPISGPPEYSDSEDIDDVDIIEPHEECIEASVDIDNDSCTHHSQTDGSLKSLFIKHTAFLWRDPITLKLSFTRITQTCLYFVVFLFLVNALIVTVAFWKAAYLTAGHVKLEHVSLIGLDKDKAYFSISGQLENTFLMNYVQFKLTKPLDINLMLLDKGEIGKVSMIASSIPSGEWINPNNRKFSFSQIEIVFNESFPFSSLVQLDDGDSFIDNLPNVSIEMDFGISTRAFWIPLWFTSVQSFPLNLSKELKKILDNPSKPSTSSQSNFIKPKELKFNETGNSFSMDCKLFIEKIPQFLHVELPALNFELKQKHYENDHVLSVSRRILSLSIPSQSIKTDQQDLSFSVNVIETDRHGISDALSFLRDKQLDLLVITLTHCSKSLSPCAGLCKWLSPFEINFPIGKIIKLIPFNLSGSELPSLDPSNPLLDVMFHNVSSPSNSPSFTFIIKIPLKDPNLKFIKNPLPTIKTNLLIDKGNRQSEFILDSSIVHVLNDKFLSFKLILTIRNLELFITSAFKMMGSNEKLKFFMKGSKDSFLSSLIFDPFSFEIDPIVLKPRFRHGKKLLLSDLLQTNNPLKKIPAASPQFTEIIRHKANVSTESSRNNLIFTGHFNFADSSTNLKLPFIKFSWNDLKFSISPISKKKSSPFLELINLK